MDAIVKKPVRNSRWTRDPVIAGPARAIAVYPTERDIEIFKLLVRFRYLPSDHIHAFVGGNEKALEPPAQSASHASLISIWRGHISSGRTPTPIIGG